MLAPELSSPPSHASPHQDREIFLDAARTAWRVVDDQYRTETGLIDSITDYPYETVWDIASGLAAPFSTTGRSLAYGR